MNDEIDQAAILEAIRRGTATDDDRLALFEKWEPLRNRIAYKFKTFLRCPDEIDDLLSESYFATMKAAETYDPEKGKGFGAWLSLYLHKSFEQYLDEQSGNGLAAGASSRISAVKRFERDHFLECGVKPPDWLICERFEISRELLDRWRVTASGARSLEEEIDDNLTLLDTLEGGEDPEAVVVNHMTTLEIRRLLLKYSRTLTKDEREAIYYHFLKGYTSESCAEIMRVSVKKFHEIKRRALKRLRTSKLKSEIGRLLPEMLGSRPYRRGSRRGSSTEVSALKIIELEEEFRRQNMKSKRKIQAEV